MLPIFPRAPRLCTRMAIKIELRRKPKVELPRLQLVEMDTLRCVEDFECPPLTMESGERDVREAMERAIKQEHEKLAGISLTHMLVRAQGGRGAGRSVCGGGSRWWWRRW